jgi:hypothetical protein
LRKSAACLPACMASPPVHARMVEMSAFSDDDEESDSDFLVQESLHHCPSLCQVCRPILTLPTTPLHLLLRFHICQSAYIQRDRDRESSGYRLSLVQKSLCQACRSTFSYPTRRSIFFSFANLHRETERIGA